MKRLFLSKEKIPEELVLLFSERFQRLFKVVFLLVVTFCIQRHHTSLLCCCNSLNLHLESLVIQIISRPFGHTLAQYLLPKLHFSPEKGKGERPNPSHSQRKELISSQRKKKMEGKGERAKRKNQKQKEKRENLFLFLELV
jgi:hypothetical protein